MYKIYKITSNPVVDFAAEELKKYLRMMMPRCGEISIEYAPDAKEGFRLGLMQDLGLDVSEAPDVSLDDILHIDCCAKGGIIAGSNPRSVLLAVYRYLQENGCRWLFPGIDGEFIPIKDAEPVKYHKMASCRYRRQCNEVAEYQPNMFEAIDFTPKIGMNIFMIEFDNPKAYYDSYYNHRANDTNREPEPVNPETVLQWKRQCEAEMSKRGLQFHDMGHGWTAESFGIDTTDGWVAKDDDEIVPPESRKYVAMINGERKLWHGVALNTNFCMSNPEARKKVALKVADYSEQATNVDYLHVWLADSSKNHCECDECRKMIPTDWYIMLMNDIDEELTARGLPTRIVCICYVDTTWAPEKITLKNPDRFSLLVAAISRDYTEPVDANLDVSKIEIKPYELNKSKLPGSVNEYLAHAKMWRDMCPIPAFVYEYHFWVPQYRDMGVFDSAKIIYDDIRGYKAQGCDGIVEDGSQRSFFPNGFCFYVYGQTLFDTEVDFEALKEDYFSTAYGEDWREVAAFFEKLGKAADYRYLNAKLSSDPEKSPYYNPAFAQSLREVATIVDEFAPFVEAHKNMPKRAQTVAYRILKVYLEYCKGLSKVLVLKAMGAGVESQRAYYEFLNDIGRYELEIERWYDHYMAYASMRGVFGKKDAYIPF